MTYGEGLLLGIVQGLTEFLPISSSGHLVVAGAVVGLRTPGVLVEVVLHVATLVSVLIVYRKELIALARGLRQGARSAWGYVGLLAVGTVPAAIAGLALGDLVARAFESLPAVGVHFLLTGTVLWSSRFVSGGEGNRPTAVGAGGIGMAQALALLPGISRSGTTVTAALWLGVTPTRAAEFSFLLAVPAIAGAALLELPNLGTGAAVLGPGPLVTSFLAALVAGVLAIRLLVRMLQRRVFHRFAPYCWIIGLVTVTWGLVR